jgi:hypothetical protein
MLTDQQLLERAIRDHQEFMANYSSPHRSTLDTEAFKNVEKIFREARKAGKPYPHFD